jgi:DNA mismatch repair ATPase MutS
MPRAGRETPPVERATLRAFVASSTVDEDHLLLDQPTWDDLDLDAVAERLDRTESLPGRMVLYRMLRTPSLSASVLAERERLIGLFEKDQGLGTALREELARLNRTVSAEELVRLLWGEPPEALPFPWVYPLLAVAAVVTLAAAVASGKLWLLATVAVLMVNSTIHFSTRARWQGELEALRFVAALLVAARRVARLEAEGLADCRRRLAGAVRQTKPLARQIAWLSSSGMRDLLYDYVNMAFLLELQACRRILVRLPATRPLLREVFLSLGELDALRGVACWRGERNGWCRPELDDGAAGLEIEDGTHPLLDGAIPNSVLLSRGALVTGANMSGKSTFLRLLGINAVLAQSIGTCTARRYRATRLRVLSSMRAADDVTRGKSHYLAEAERLHTLVRLVGSGPTLCLIDELLSGTNAVERLAASAAILEHLAESGALVVAATHDLELAEQLVGVFDAYNFADDFAGCDLRFDHRIRAGLATRRNAIQLLEHLGYPQELVDPARARL